MVKWINIEDSGEQAVCYSFSPKELRDKMKGETKVIKGKRVQFTIPTLGELNGPGTDEEKNGFGIKGAIIEADWARKMILSNRLSRNDKNVIWQIDKVINSVSDNEYSKIKYSGNYLNYTMQDYNPNIVVGLPGICVDSSDGTVYYGTVDGLTHVLDQENCTFTTIVRLGSVRAITKKDDLIKSDYLTDDFSHEKISSKYERYLKGNLDDKVGGSGYKSLYAYYYDKNDKRDCITKLKGATSIDYDKDGRRNHATKNEYHKKGLTYNKNNQKLVNEYIGSL